jgi:gamma-glutamylcyclotransferase (GGCT)/AIG2-like uncharacterized protein YtfP
LIRTLFFYGVLMPGLVSGRMAELVALLGPPRPATVSGRLFAVPDPRGHYPVMVATAGAERVSGAMLAPGPSFGAVELAELDAFEGFDPADPSGSDYIRAGLHAGSGRLPMESDCRRRFHRDPPRRLRPLPRRGRRNTASRLICLRLEQSLLTGARFTDTDEFPLGRFWVLPG